MWPLLRPEYFLLLLLTSESEDRQPKVLELRTKGPKVTYIGDVIDDIIAMASADVAIGLAEDEKDCISKTVCDVILGGDVLWLSVLFVLSRRYVQANRFDMN